VTRAHPGGYHEARQLGRYRIVRCIGRGGMGDVWLARYEALPGVMRLAAIKMLRPDAASTASPAKLLEEARVNAYASHANVAAVLDAGVDEGVSWLALEYVPGPTLRAIFDAAWAGTPLSPWLFASIAARACAGLAAVHEAKSDTGQPLSIVHRDVSPQNLIVSWDGVVKLVDFGIARSAIAAARTATGTIKGKLGYMAPEQVRGQPVDRRADIFALGVVLWEALARRRLFFREDEAQTFELVYACTVPPLSDVAPDVPPALAAIVHRALAAEPSGRFWTALEMKQALDAAMMQAGVNIGEPEIAASLAMLLPDRVREHERWLAEAERQGPLAEATTVLESVRDEPPPDTARLDSARRPSGTVPLAKPLAPLTSPAAHTLPSPAAHTAPAQARVSRPDTPPPPAPHVAPRGDKTSRTIFVGACVAGVAIASVLVGGYFFTRTARGVDSAFVSTVPSGVQPEGRGVEPPEPAPPPGTPETSQRAAPSWPPRAIIGNIGEYAPQLSDGLQAFMAAVPFGDAPIERALIVCRIQSSGKADTLSGDDLHVRAVFGATPLVANDGPEDANLAFVSAPVAKLDKGASVHFEVYDRDVFALEEIAKTQASWKGGTLALRATNATIECRQLAGDALQRLVSIRAARADVSTAKLHTTQLDGRSYDWGWPAADVKTARRDVSDVAGLVGWDDARALKRVLLVDAAIASIDAKKRAVFDSLYADAKSESATVAGVTITAREPSCADHGAACTIHLMMKNDSDKPLMRTGWAGVKAYAATQESGAEPASFELRTMEPGNLEPGASLETTATPARTLALGKGPALLGVCREGQCAAIRLR
jgi:eukaryotic-like serine/threonine-protein kinase